MMMLSVDLISMASRELDDVTCKSIAHPARPPGYLIVLTLGVALAPLTAPTQASGQLVLYIIVSSWKEHLSDSMPSYLLIQLAFQLALGGPQPVQPCHVRPLTSAILFMRKRSGTDLANCLSSSASSSSS